MGVKDVRQNTTKAKTNISKVIQLQIQTMFFGKNDFFFFFFAKKVKKEAQNHTLKKKPIL